MTTKTVFLCAAKRTAIGSFQGALATENTISLGAHVLGAVLAESKLQGENIQEVIMGCVLQAGLGQAPARQAMIKAGLPNNVQAMTINKVCSSGLKAVMLAANSVALGQADAVIAGGMESMSNAPYYMASLRSGARLGHAQAEDSIIKDGLWDPYKNFHMGNAAEMCAVEHKLTREMQDAFAIESYARAMKAIASGAFEAEISPYKIQTKKGDVEVKVDEEPGKGNPEKIPGLKPAFQKDGTVTAANASSLNDGAAAMLVCSEEFAKKHNLKPLARVLAQGWNAQAPEWFTTAPIGAVQNAVQNAGLKLEQIDLFEINEAFSAVALACQYGLNLPSEKLNIYGGAVALGHPIGASGARILTTLMYALQKNGKKLGVAGICNGGGEATAVVIERI